MRLAGSLALVLALGAGAASAAGVLDRIRDGGTVRFGYREDAAPLSYLGENETPAGYSVLVCEAVAASLGRQLGRELAVGMINGAVLGSVVALLATVLGGDPMLGLVVLLAMWGNLAVAGFLGSFVPSIMDRMGLDPAVSSSMFVTPFTDLCGFLFLLGLASALLL